MKQILQNYTYISLCITSLLIVGACTSISSRNDSVNKILEKNQLSRDDFTTPQFQLASWKKLTSTALPIHVYIEGDGLAWASRYTPSNNPTPTHPVALELASQDPTPNVVYIARPCQYTDFTRANNNCSTAYWTSKRFSKEVIQSYQNALDQLSKNNKSGFHLIGFSGGANISGLLAATRDDILSFSSVAGNIDNDFFIKYHKVSDMPDSLNMADYALKLSNVPQYHFIAEKDKIVPIGVFQSYEQKMGSSNCIQKEVVSGTTHINGWGERWKELLKKAFTVCLPIKSPAL